jgi:hypothetical protein
LQVASFTLTCAFSAFWFSKWAAVFRQNYGLAGEDRIWPGLGWFSGLVCIGSAAGAAAWTARMQRDSFFYQRFTEPRQVYYQNASIRRWNAAFNVAYGIEFLCLVIPKLMMLGRLTDNTTGSAQAHGDRVRRWWHQGRTLPAIFKVMSASVLVCSVAGMLALDTSAAFALQASTTADDAAAACNASGHDTDVSISLKHADADLVSHAATAASVQRVCEALTLLLLTLSYIILVVCNVAVYRRAEHAASCALLSLSETHDAAVDVPAVFAAADYAGSIDARVSLRRRAAVAVLDDTRHAAANQRRRLIAACVIVLLSFPARAAFDLLLAYATFSDPLNPSCGACAPCQSQRFLINTWINYSPEFQPVIVALSSALPLACSLWLMMSAWERRGVDVNKTEEEQQAIAARARLGVDLPRPLREVLGT